MVQGRNTLGYLRNRTFYIPERKYACIDHKMFDMFASRNVKKNLEISTLTSELESVDSQIKFTSMIANVPTNK